MRKFYTKAAIILSLGLALGYQGADTVYAKEGNPSITSDTAVASVKLDDKIKYATKRINEFKDAVQNDDRYKNATIGRRDDYEAHLNRLIDVVNQIQHELPSFADESDYKIAEGLIDHYLKNAENRFEALYDETQRAHDKLGIDIASANELVSQRDKYTEESFKKFNTALIGATTTANSANATIPQIEASQNALEIARAGLVKKPNPRRASQEKVDELKRWIFKLEVKIEYAEGLMVRTPKTIAPVKKELEELIKIAHEQIASARKLVAKYEGIKG